LGLQPHPETSLKVAATYSHVLPANDCRAKEQSRLLPDADAQLAEGLDDIRKGRVSPKFDTVDEMLASLKAGPKSKPRQKKPRSR
jgi:hypothetical protein